MLMDIQWRCSSGLGIFLFGSEERASLGHGVGTPNSDIMPKSMGEYTHGKMHTMSIDEGQVQDTEEQKKNQECSRDREGII